VRLWWPNGYGDQFLYPYLIRFDSEDETESSQQIIKVGFRTVKLMQTYINRTDTRLGGVTLIQCYKSNCRVAYKSILNILEDCLRPRVLFPSQWSTNVLKRVQLSSTTHTT